MLGPLALQQVGFDTRGVGKIEQLLPDFSVKLKNTVALVEKKSLLNATEYAAKLYLELRQSDISPCYEAQSLSLNFLDELRTSSAE